MARRNRNQDEGSDFEVSTPNPETTPDPAPVTAVAPAAPRRPEPQLELPDGMRECLDMLKEGEAALYEEQSKKEQNQDKRKIKSLESGLKQLKAHIFRMQQGAPAIHFTADHHARLKITEKPENESIRMQRLRLRARGDADIAWLIAQLEQKTESEQ